MKENDNALHEVEKFWDSRPCNIKHSAAPLGSYEWCIEVEKRRYFVEPHIQEFADFSNSSGLKILEIGCGIGTDAANFVKYGADYTGIDISAESIKLAIQRFQVLGLRGRFIKANVEEIDTLFAGERFDVIYSFGVLHHTPNFQLALEAVSRIMNENTVLKVMVYATNSWKNAMIMAGLDQYEAQSGVPIANTFTVEEIHKEMTKAGLVCLEVRQDHIFPYKVDAYREYRYELEPWFENMPDKVFAALKRSLGWHLMVVAKKNFEV